MPKVAVIVTVLNEEKTILKLLDALAAQTLLADEVVIADGGSSDHTSQLIQDYAQAQPQLHLKRIQVKGNRSVGRNAAISSTNAEWIAITDAGCVPHHNWLEKLVQQAQKISAKEFVVAGYYDAHPKSNFEEAVVPYVLVMPDRVNPTDFLPATRSMLVSKSAWKKVGGFNEHLSDNEDYAFAHALKNHGVVMSFTSEAKVEWIPRSTIQQFSWMIFRFARGDAQSRIWRPKVLFVFARYLVAITVATIWVVLDWPLLMLIGVYVVSLALYAVWAVWKNIRYTHQSWYWLPILQILADVMVMAGTVKGAMMKVSKKEELK